MNIINRKIMDNTNNEIKPKKQNKRVILTPTPSIHQVESQRPSAYEKNKKNIYKWREKNKEKYNDLCNKAQAIYYVKNKERISQRKKEWYLRRKAAKLENEKNDK